MDSIKPVIPQEIRTYLESLIQEANVPAFDEKTKEDLLSYLFEKLDKYLAAKIVENMSEEDTKTFIQMNKDKKSQEEIDAFLNTHMQNPQDVFTRAFIDFRDFYLTGQNTTPVANDSKSAANMPTAPVNQPVAPIAQPEMPTVQPAQEQTTN